MKGINTNSGGLLLADTSAITYLTENVNEKKKNEDCHCSLGLSKALMGNSERGETSSRKWENKNKKIDYV